MGEEKDRLGDKLRELERGREEVFFAKQDKALIEKLRSSLTEEQRAQVRDFARMRCPKCLEPLQHVEHLGVQLEECPKCKGIFVDRGELEQLEQRETAGWLSRFLGR